MKVLLLFLTACGPTHIIYPGTSLVIVEPDQDLEADQAENIRTGIRFWDKFDPCCATPEFRTIDQLPADFSIQDVPVLKMHNKSVSLCNAVAPLKNEQILACYRPTYGDIIIDLSLLNDPKWNTPDLFKQDLFAHEVGHAMGLGHVPGCVAVMSPGCIESGITDADRGEYYGLWAGK